MATTMAKGTPSSSTKLHYLLRKLLQQQQPDDREITTRSTGEISSRGGRGRSPAPAVRLDDLVSQLCQQHREYQRKDYQSLRSQVAQALDQITRDDADDHQHTTPSATNPIAPSPKSSRKRRASRPLDPEKSGQNDPDRGDDHQRPTDDEGDDDSYEQAAREDEAQRARVGVGGGLNAALRGHYRQVQQKRDAEAAEAAAAAAAVAAVAVEENCPDVSGLDTVALQQNQANLSPSPSEGRTASNSRPESQSVQHGAQQVKRKRTKKRSLVTPASWGDRNMLEDSGPDAMGAMITQAPRPAERYADLGGMDEVIQQIRQLVEYPIMRPELYQHLGVEPPRGVLLRGPPGCGKTHLANAVAGQLGVTYFRVSAPELVSGMSGESEGRIRTLFKAASDMAPAIIFLDELDAIAPKRSEAGSQRGMEKRMVAQLLTSMDMLAPENNRQKAAVLILAATNRPDALDPALRRAGRFDKEILLGVPDEEARKVILRTMTKGMRLSGDFDYKVLARKTPGFVGADLKSVAKEAAVVAINRIFRDVLATPTIENTESPAEESKKNKAIETPPLTCVPLSKEQMDPLFVTMDDFLQAIPLVQPSSKREGFATVPDVSWEDIGALQSIRDELTISVLEPIRNPEKFQALGLSLPAGVLLFGPPGCGKTLLAKAIAHESGANFISVKGPELLDKYVGESERAVRLVFERARSSSPCVVFFDELDSLVPKRGSDAGGSGVSERVVNQLLTEMDGLESRRSVFVIAATNRPELIDPAMLRPGRLDKLLYVPLPSPQDRASILTALATKVKLADDINLIDIAKSQRADGYSGADCAALLREAGLAVLKEDAAAHAAGLPGVTPFCISQRHFDQAFGQVLPSVSKKDQIRYDRIRDRISRARTRGRIDDDDAGEGQVANPTELDSRDHPPSSS